MVINHAKPENHTPVDNRDNVNTPLGTGSPNVYRGFS